MFFEAGDALGGMFNTVGEGAHGNFKTGLEIDQPHELVGEVHVIDFQIGFAASHTDDNLFHVTKVFVQFVGFFADFDEALIRLVDFTESVDECVGEVIKHAVALVGHGGAARGAEPHVSIPVRRLEEDGEDGAAAKDGVKAEPLKKAVEGMCTALGEVGSKAVTADIFHLVFVRQRGDSGRGVFPIEGFVEEDKIRETTPYREGGFLKGLEVGLEET